MRLFDIAPVLWNARRAHRPNAGPFSVRALQASFDLLTTTVFVPLGFDLNIVPRSCFPQLCFLVKNRRDIQQVKAIGATAICVRCPANDLLARLGHRDERVFLSSAESLFHCSGLDGVDSKLTVGQTFDSLSAATHHVSELLEFANMSQLQSIVLLDSALGCRYKSSVEVPELVDITNTLLHNGFADHVVWEEGPRGGLSSTSHKLYPSVLVPRVAENLAKTAVAGGIDMKQVSFMLRDNDFTTREVIRKMMALGHISAVVDSSGLCRTDRTITAPSPYISSSQFLSAVADVHGDQCPEELMDALEGYLEIEEALKEFCTF